MGLVDSYGILDVFSATDCWGKQEDLLFAQADLLPLNELVCHMCFELGGRCLRGVLFLAGFQGKSTDV